MRTPTQQDVAREAGVSRTLVSRALRGSGRVSAAKRNRILEVASRLGYRPNDAAVALASSRSGVIGVILPSLRNPFYDAISEALQTTARSAGLTTMFTICGQDEIAALAQAESFLRLRAVGLVMVAPNLSDANLRSIGNQTALCILGHAPVGGRVDCSRVDEKAAAYLVIDALIKRGFTSAIQLGPDDSSLDPNGKERRSALTAEGHHRGLALTNVVVPDEGGRVVQDLLGSLPHPTALIAHNDVLGINVVAAVGASGLRLGAEVSVVSYDNTYLAAREEFALSSIDQQPTRLGSQAIEAILSRTQSANHEPEFGRDLQVAPQLIVRASLPPLDG